MTNERFARLMAGLLAGDRSALREVYEAYAGLVYALALSVTGRREDADAEGIWGAGCWFCTGHIRSGTVPSNRGATCLRMDYLVYADRS